VVALRHGPDWPAAEPVRVAFVTGRKVGTAVVRNTVRRRLREAFRALLRRVVVPTDIAIIAHPASASLPYQELAAALEGLLTRAGVLGGEGP
jgi:ribonuclease P protein component